MKIIRYVSIFLVAATLLAVLSSCGDDRWKEVKKNCTQTVLPAIHINTQDGRAVEDRETDLEMTLSVTGAENEKYNLTSVTGTIRGRGNSSWNFCEKKSYRLKLDLKINLLGTGDGGDRDWALISNAREKSMLRNYAVLLLAQKMGMEAVTDCSFVKVFLNDEYIGVYLLCETVKFGKNRLDIDVEKGKNDTGYLLELDRWAYSEGTARDVYFYVNDWNVPFVIKSKGASAEQRSYIKEYMSETDRAILSGNRENIEKYIDLASAVDLYIIEEFTKDRDVGFSSFFVYKESGGKLKFGFPWDFDLALGNDSGEDRLHEENSPKLDYKGTSGVVAGVLNRWFAALTGEEWFLKLTAERFGELSEVFDEMFAEVAQTGYSLCEEAERNYRRWKIMGKKQLFEPQKVVRIKTYSGQVDYLLWWMEKRCQWLDDHFSAYAE